MRLIRLRTAISIYFTLLYITATARLGKCLAETYVEGIISLSRALNGLFSSHVINSLLSVTVLLPSETSASAEVDQLRACTRTTEKQSSK